VHQPSTPWLMSSDRLNASRAAAEATLQAHRASLTASLPAGCALNSILAPYACLSSLEPNRIARDTRAAPFVDVLFSDITESGEVLDLGELRVKSPARTARLIPLSEWRTRRSRYAQVTQKNLCPSHRKFRPATPEIAPEPSGRCIFRIGSKPGTDSHLLFVTGVLVLSGSSQSEGANPGVR
jgi:hypothetical protein